MFGYPVGQDFLDEILFDPHVGIGRIVKREYSVPILLRRNGDPEDLCALPHEQWRIDAYILLRQVVNEEGWNLL